MSTQKYYRLLKEHRKKVEEYKRVADDADRRFDEAYDLIMRAI